MRRKRVGQGALAIASWILFIYYWWLVSRRRLNPETVTSLLVLVVLVASVFLFTLVWIRHNQRIARRAGDRRSQRRPLPAAGTVDTLGRALLDQGELRVTEAAYVEIEIDDDAHIKRYEAMSAPPLAVEASAEASLSSQDAPPPEARP